MGRTYVRKTKRGADGERYTSEALARAVADVRNQNKTIKGASKAYNIPRTTLRHRLRDSRGKGQLAQGGSGGGRSTDLSFDEEKRLADSLKTLEKWGFGLTKFEALDVVQNYVTQNELKTRFKDNRPGEEWYLSFAHRHGLSLKIPQGVEYSRMDQVNPFVIYSYFDQLEQTMADLKIKDKPYLIYNLDESSFCHDPRKAKVVGAVGVKSTRMISSPGRENTSILICCSASGDKIPPLIIFKGKNVLEHWINVNENDKTCYAASQRGWMETTIFSKWFKQCFLPNAPPERPLLLIYDGHSTHVSIELIEEALANDVTILKLPPHTTHLLQPMDTAVFKSLKNHWEKELVTWQRQNPRQRIPKPTFVQILNKVYDKLTVEVIKNGFRVAGICPLSRDAIKPDIFKPEDLRAYEQKKRKKTLQMNNNENSETSSSSNFENPSVSFHVTADTMNSNFVPQSTTNLNQNSIAPQPGTSSNADSLLTNLNEKQPEEPVEEPSAMEEPIKHLNSQENSFEDIIVRFIKGSNNTPAKAKSRKRLCPNSEIITTKEYLEKRKMEEEQKKNVLEQKEKRKKDALKRKEEKQKNLLKKKKQTRKMSSSSSSDNESDISMQEHESESETDDSIEVLPEDFVIVSYESKYYPGQVMEIGPENQVVIKHMTQTVKTDGWKWPKMTDILTYEKKEILKIIPPPTPINNRGIFKVPALSKMEKHVYS